ncbi:asparagine synthetase B family protein [Thalassotalea atypica]|uniref:asparagine synthetase B family protein n=1 Tax=Thalassotalea atypica TaxID=2054316 RepID=UPI00257368B9|nr:asparagine synthase C-terminal domain-containing protein [Thalassotalea atypica]
MFSENSNDINIVSDPYSRSFNVGDSSIQIMAKRSSSYVEYEHLGLFSYAKVLSDDYLIELLEQLDSKNESLNIIYQTLSRAFSFVLLDYNAGKVTLFNDHIGCNNCFYYQTDNSLIISDSLPLIHKEKKHALKISEQAIFNYMYFHCIPSPTTIYNNVFKLEPGKAVIFDRQLSKTEQVLYAPKFATKCENPEALYQECLTEIDHSVAAAMTENCGAFLSGGLDSSTVSGMLAKHKTPAKTFSIGFEAKGYDETEYAKITAKHFGTQHKVLYLKSEQAAEEFVTVAQYFDEPFGNSSSMAAYFCAKFAKEHGVDTLLAGDGGDELFAGNERYAKQKQFELFYKLPRPIRGFLNVGLNNNLMAKIPGISKAASYVRQAEVKLPARLQSYNFINIVGLTEMFTPEFLAKVDTDIPIKQLEQRYAESKGEHPVDNMLYLDWKFTLADNDLVKVNRMCELAGVNVEYPLLSKRLVDFSCKVPADVKLPGYKLRDFYKKACRGFLADETLDKSKHGFGLPFGVWLKENKKLEKIAMDALEQFKVRNIVSESLINKALAAHQSVHTGYYGELIWIMVVLELWLQGNED